MTWFSLPITQAGNKAAFADAAGATAWLAQQPQANVAAMQAELTRQIQALNTYRLAPRERFKTLEVLRKTLFTVDSECRRRFENRPIPLWSSEQVALDTARRLWRACAIAYLHCLRACLDGDPGVAELKAKIAHRALICLRMEQLTCYLGALDVEPDFWRYLHSVLASAEQLEVAHLPVSDRSLGETNESTINGQYAMTILLHLARPFELSRTQFAAATRWLARWREQTEILSAPDSNPRATSVMLDLSQDSPTLESERTPGFARWLSISGVLRKIRKRLELLEAGESPENLKLGSGISSESSIALLKTLTDNLKNPLPTVASPPRGTPVAKVAVGMEAIHRQLGGKSLKAAEEPSSMNRHAQDQIAIFGHVPHEVEDKNAIKPEEWLIVEKGDSELRLCRPAGKGKARLNNKCLLAIQLPNHSRSCLALLSSLCTHCDGSLHATARIFPGDPVPLIAEVRERPMGRMTRQPAFLLPANATLNTPQSVFIPAGVSARALSINLLQDRPITLRLGTCLEHGSDYERWIYEAS
jgi:hypothetical protein